MVNVRIIPGVQVAVVKEVVPSQLAPSGVLGIVGLSEKGDPSKVQRAGSWSRFVELFGPGSAHSMREARQALDNGIFELVVSLVDRGSAGLAKVELKGIVGDDPKSVVRFDLEARSPGNWANETRVEILRVGGRPGMRTFDLSLNVPGSLEPEVHRQLTATPGTPRYIGNVLENSSTIATARIRGTTVGIPVELEAPEPLVPSDDDGSPELSLLDIYGDEVLKVVRSSGNSDLAVTVNQMANGARIAIHEKASRSDAFTLSTKDVDDLVAITVMNDADLLVTVPEGTNEFLVEPQWTPDINVTELSGGVDATALAYRNALRRLEEAADVDMVLAAIQDYDNDDRLVQIYSDIISHCQRMSDDCKGRIGFGQVPAGGEFKDHVEIASSLTSDRFVMAAPHGVVGGVAGLVGGLPYFHAPTFKPVAGLGSIIVELNVESQRQYLRANIVPVAVEHGVGLVVLRGLTTDGDQISVRRVADRAVRGVKSRGDLFIGRLNNANGRAALRQKITEFLTQMQKAGAIVPSTDGSDPAFKIDVYSSQDDFALGIVRIDMAVRPVRAIDYIYATILVQT